MTKPGAAAAFLFLLGTAPGAAQLPERVALLDWLTLCCGETRHEAFARR